MLLLAWFAGGCRSRAARVQLACDDSRPACGGDGRVYATGCAARAAGVAPGDTSRCHALVPGWASCGARYCDARSSYCEIFLSDVPELPTGYHCRGLPPTCRGAAARCDCLHLHGPSFCGHIVTGGPLALHVTWQGVKEPLR